ncbi:MAG: amino acid adenylation domain-containing protein [Acidobacteria bacterium]|nr:amino acid adenylation domain-containing protein [Acidobacteriota bacterium]
MMNQSDWQHRWNNLSPDKRRLMEIKWGRRLGTPTAVMPEIPAREEGAGIPLSFAQQRFWLLDQLAAAGAYRNPFLIHIRGPLRADILPAALQRLHQRHEILRTTVFFTDKGARQIVQPESQPRLQVMEEPGLSFTPPDASTVELLRRLSRMPLDFEKGPLTRYVLLRVRQDEHALLVLTHHLIFDGWSKLLFRRELAAACEDILHNRPADAAPGLQFGDFACWEQRQAAVADVQPALDYWRGKLHSCPPLQLPTDYPRPAMESFRGAWCPVTLDAELMSAMREFGHENRLTPFMILLAGWAILLQRYASQDDFAIGIPVAGRPHPALENMIGCLMNSQVYRADLAADPTARQLLAAIRQDILAMGQYQDLSFARVVEELQPPRDLSRSPLFQMMFNFRNFPVPPPPAGDLILELVPVDFGIARFELTLDMEPIGDLLRGHIEYNTDLFAAETIRRMIRHYEHVMQQLLSRPDEPVSRIDLMTEQERSSLLVLSSGPLQPSTPIPLMTRIEQQATQGPDRPALVFDETVVTYGELITLTRRAARRLAAQGMGPGRRVGILLPRSSELVLAVLAVLRCGAAFVPLAPEDPRDRRRFILEDAAPDLLITRSPDEDFWGITVPIQSWPTLSVPAEPVGSDPSLLPVSNSADEAYLIYTSGSTGRPKGVAVRRQALDNCIGWLADFLRVTPRDVLLHQANFSFDFAFSEIFTALIAGAGLVVASPDGSRDSAYLVDLIRRHGITLLQGVPGWLRLLADHGGIFHCPSVTRIVAGGEICPPDLARAFMRKGVAVYNGYGPTETCIFATMWPCTKDYEAATLPIGRPIRDCWVYILDRHQRPVPPGVAGEIYIGGINVAQGYHRRPELTAECFLPDPFRPGGTERMFRSGDWGRYLADGNIEFMGRRDRQIKLRGFRIEPGEIENSLRSHPQVGQAAVILQPSKSSGDQLAAYVAPIAGHSTISIPQLRRFLARKLPYYMIPARMECVTELPVLPSGKVDYGRLPTCSVPSVMDDDPSPPRTVQEKHLADIWREILELESISRRQHFFHSGGHSLLATRLVVRLEKALGLAVPLRVVFDRPRLDELAEWIDRQLSIPEPEVESLVDEIMESRRPDQSA